jgi:nascent polypeptide-associated complex subunit alpha
MFGGLGGINPAQMKAMMSRMGIKQEDVKAERVIIEKADGSRTVIEPANVVKMTMQGQSNWQVTGEAKDETKKEGISEEDVNLVMEKTGVSKHEAEKMLKEVNGDIAEAIVRLS